MPALRLAALFLIAFVFASAQTDPGRREYEARCSRCHGADATGGEGGPNIQAQIAARSATETCRVPARRAARCGDASLRPARR